MEEKWCGCEFATCDKVKVQTMVQMDTNPLPNSFGLILNNIKKKKNIVRSGGDCASQSGVERLLNSRRAVEETLLEGLEAAPRDSAVDHRTRPPPPPL